jgi:hypothetical protein
VAARGPERVRFDTDEESKEIVLALIENVLPTTNSGGAKPDLQM